MSRPATGLQDLLVIKALGLVNQVVGEGLFEIHCSSQVNSLFPHPHRLLGSLREKSVPWAQSGPTVGTMCPEGAALDKDRLAKDTTYGVLDRLLGGSGRKGGSSGSGVSSWAVGETDSRTPVETERLC